MTIEPFSRRSNSDTLQVKISAALAMDGGVASQTET
jgi:hypothetical protein